PGARDEGPYWAETLYTFNTQQLPQDLQWLRTPHPERIFSLDNNNTNGTGTGQITLIGRESIGSWFEQALVARRQTHFSYDAETVLDGYAPADERQYAGLTAYYSRYNFLYLAVTAHSDGSRELLVMSSEASYPESKLRADLLLQPVSIPGTGKVRLGLSVRGRDLQFYYAVAAAGESDADLKARQMEKVGPVLDASLVSDECGGHQLHGSFTGAFVGLACSDLNGTALEARFDYLLYRPVRHHTDRYDV
ncbi:beta-xylosidase, partial [Magnaporthiopsis poae ATCC 64411]